MKTYKIVFLFILLITASASYSQQDTFDGIKISIENNSSNVFYEGQSISFVIRIENLTNEQKPYEATFFPFFEKIVDENGKEIKKVIVKEINDFHVQNSEDIVSTTVYHPVPPSYAYVFPTYTGYGLYGNRDIRYYLSIPDSLYGKWSIPPIFFQPGKYQIIVACQLKPSLSIIRTEFKFEVVPATGIIKEQLMQYLSALEYTYNHSWMRGVELVSSESENTLWKVLKNDRTSPYSQEILRILTIEPEFKIPSIKKFRESDAYIFQAFTLIPELTNINSDEVAADFYSMYTRRIRSFKEIGYMDNYEFFLDSYLKKIQHLHPVVSEDLINRSKKNLGLTNLKNYAKEREDKLKKPNE